MRQLLPCVSGVNFAVGPAGTYYAACGDGPRRSIHLLDQAGTRSSAWYGSRPVGYDLNRLAVSPDGKTILVQQQTFTLDLSLIENFR